jgi:hypothetical protein
LSKGTKLGLKIIVVMLDLLILRKKIASPLKTRAAATHPLVVACKDKVLRYFGTLMMR